MNLSQEVIFEDLINAVLSYDAEKVADATRKALSLGIDPLKIIEDGLAKSLRIVGKKFEDGELFIMHLVAASEVAKRALTEVLEPEILKRKVSRKVLGKVVIGTAAGDIHDIGKNIVAAMLFTAGFEVYDLGKDVPVKEFIKRAKEVSADIVAVSTLLSTTLHVQRDIIKALNAWNMREKVKVMVGGAPVTGEWAEEIGADGYGENAVEAARVAKKLLNIAE